MRSFFGNFQNRRRRNSNARPNGVRQDQAAFMNNFVNNLFEAQQNEEPQGPPPTDPRVLRELKNASIWRTSIMGTKLAVYASKSNTLATLRLPSVRPLFS